jgi:hypothetical protein
MPGKKRSSHLFTSKAQQRWAFATHQPWAHKHAEANEQRRPYRSLPPRVGARKKA